METEKCQCNMLNWISPNDSENSYSPWAIHSKRNYSVAHKLKPYIAGIYDGDHMHAYSIAACRILSRAFHSDSNEINFDKPFCISIDCSQQMISFEFSNHNAKRDAKAKHRQRKGQGPGKRK